MATSICAHHLERLRKAHKGGTVQCTLALTHTDTEQRRECVCAHARKGNRFSVRLRKLTPKNTYKKTMMMMLSIGPPVSNKKRGAILNFRATPAQKRKSIIPARPSPGMFLIYDIFMLMAFACASVSVSVHECVCMCVFMGTCMCVCLRGFRHKDDASDKKLLRVLYKPYEFVADGCQYK